MIEGRLNCSKGGFDVRREASKEDAARAASIQADGFGPVTLISADQALNDAAMAEGLTVDDPNAHP